MERIARAVVAALIFPAILAAADVKQISEQHIAFPVGGVPAFIMRRVYPPDAPDGATDFRILGRRNAPAILSLIGPDRHRYADYTFNGSDADIDVSHGS